MGHLGILTLLPSALLILLIWIFPKPRLILPLAVSVTTLLGVTFIIDICIYKLFHFHLNGIIFNLAAHGLNAKILGLSLQESLFIFVALLGLLVGEAIFAGFLWKKIKVKIQPSRFWLSGILGVFGFALYFSYFMLISSANYPINRIMIDATRFLPFYAELSNTLVPVKGGLLYQLERKAELHCVQANRAKAPLNYPLHAMQYEEKSRHKNVVIIVIDAWRFDMLNSSVTPHIAEFAKKSWVFNQHFSGGNATGPGMFSLFYGLPVTYWSAMESEHRAPLLIDEMQKQDYQIGVFASAGIEFPPFYKTIFNSIKNLDPKMRPGNNAYERDKNVTKNFMDFMQHYSAQQPFFTFLFYDVAHSYCGFDNPNEKFQPSIKECSRYELRSSTDPLPYLNRYKNALVTVDEEVQKVIAVLREKKLLDNTVVMITGDHGEEFNDNHRGFWGHANNYTHYQVQTPLIIYWPSEKPVVFTHKTSHFDIVPTLMKKLFACKNPASDYSLGISLLDKGLRPYLIVGSYMAFGIVESGQITAVSPTGTYEVEKLNGQKSPDGHVNTLVLQQVFGDLRHFFKA
jgi:membrane-anchored protein YejM (alkaline phosphatase superfamily)